MKKLMLLTFALSLFACSSDDSNSSTINYTFNPPSWIQGIWLNSNSAGWEFRQDLQTVEANLLMNLKKYQMI